MHGQQYIKNNYHIIRYTLSYVYHEIFSGSSMWVCKFGRAALVPYQTSSDGNGIGLWERLFA